MQTLTGIQKNACDGAQTDNIAVDRIEISDFNYKGLEDLEKLSDHIGGRIEYSKSASNTTRLAVITPDDLNRKFVLSRAKLEETFGGADFSSKQTKTEVGVESQGESITRSTNKVTSISAVGSPNVDGLKALGVQVEAPNVGRGPAEPTCLSL